MIQYLLSVEEQGDALVDATEAHEGKSQEASGDESYGHTVHTFGNAYEAQLLAQSGKHDECQGEAERGGQGEDDAGEEVGLKTLAVVSAVGHEDSHAEDAAVGGNQRKEHAERLIERGRELLQHDFDHLHEGSDDEDEGDGLQILQAEGVEHPYLHEIGDDGGNDQHEGYGQAHALGGLYFLGYAEEGADAEEL